jgi:Putative zinc-finger
MRNSIEKSLTRIFRTSSGREERGWGCLTESEIAAFADRQATGGERERMETHLDRCVYCREQVAFLAGLNEAEYPQNVPPAWLARARDLTGSGRRDATTWRWRWGTAAAAAACLVLVTLVTVQRLGQGSRSVPELSPTVAPLVRGAMNLPSVPELIWPVPGASVSARGLQFRWKPVEGARGYKISILTTAGDLAWEEQTQSTSANPPADMNLIPGQKYFVWIRAYLQEDKSVQSRAVPIVISKP